MAKIVTMGEMLLRLSTDNYKRFVQADSFAAFYGGSEANVAVSLAMFGHSAKYVTKVPDNDIGHSAVTALKKMGVDISGVSYGGKRLGIYFVEKGSSFRGSKVVYDRECSSMCEAEVSDFDFEKLFDGADWFHFSGITPAISEKARQLTLEAVKRAKNKGLTVSCDLNFRKKLWSKETARQIMPMYMEYVDVCMGGREDAIKMLGFHLPKTNADDTPNLEAYEEMFSEMIQKYDFKYVVSSLRQSYTSSSNELGGCIYDGKELYASGTYKIEPMVDRIGGGDAFAAGIISSLVNGKTAKESIEFATAASVLKHTIQGDANLVTEEEVEQLIHKKGIGRVSR